MWKNYAKNMDQKLVPDPYLILVNNVKHPLHARRDWVPFSKNFKFFEKGTQSLLMEKVIKNKRGLELVTSWSSGYETRLERFFY